MRYIQTYLKAVQSFEAYVKLLISKVLFPCGAAYRV